MNIKKLVILKKIKYALVFLFLLSPTLSYTQDSEKKSSADLNKPLYRQWTQNASNETGKEKPNYPFFWEIERAGKKSYILGTIHNGVSFEELPYHEDIKSYLREADFLFTEIPYTEETPIENKPRLLTDKTKALVNELEEIIKNNKEKDYSKEFLNLSKEKRDFLMSLWIKRHFKNYENTPSQKEVVHFIHENYIDLISMTPYELRRLMLSFSPIVKEPKESLDMDKQLDRDIEYYFLKNKKSRPVTPSNVVTDHFKNMFIEKLGQEMYNEVFPEGLPESPTHKEFTSSLDDLWTRSLIDQVEMALIQMEDIKDWMENHSNRLSEETMTQILNYDMHRYNTRIKALVSGTLNYENPLDDESPGRLKTETRQNAKSNKWVIDFRNQLWLPKIIEAHETYNSVFIVAGIAHFIRQERNPLNIPELKKYTEQNKDLPTNVLDMLKKEGFKVTRFGEGDFVPAGPCQKSFL